MASYVAALEQCDHRWFSAGTMEGGRQADVAKGILGAKNFPYIVAAPLLLQVRLVTAFVELTGNLKEPAGQSPFRASAQAAG